MLGKYLNGTMTSTVSINDMKIRSQDWNTVLKMMVRFGVNRGPLYVFVRTSQKCRGSKKTKHGDAKEFQRGFIRH
jgi:hypothetical protein